jgi:hypothetical protein
MAIQISLNKSQILDLKILLELGPEVLGRVVQRIEQLDSAPLAPAELHAAVKEVLPDNPTAVDSVMRQALSLASLRRRRKLDADQVLAGIRHGLKTANAAWGPPSLSEWEQIEPSFRALIASPKVETTAKALDLSYDYANLLQTTRIVTDIRPVFDNEVTRIDGAVVSFTLRMNYDNLEGAHSLSIAMNQADVEFLREQCDRALKKSILARDTLDRLPLRVTISGSKDYEPR